jgi:hypothetical protein
MTIDTCSPFRNSITRSNAVRRWTFTAEARLALFTAHFM